MSRRTASKASLSESLGQPAKVEGVSFWWFSGASVEGVDLGGGAFRLAGLKADPDALHWWILFNCVKGQGIWVGSAAAFNRAFKREFGAPPAKWRRSAA